ncbi:MAG: hypothetical protein NZM10_01630 [Fimbriimonadales bacterium]|nr:hypothetical protein [Fimbriimonadales bacterium]
MNEIEAIIVAVTHMHEGRCCVGALQVERDEAGQLVPIRNWRVLQSDGSFPLLSETMFRVGDIWRLLLTPSPAYKLKPPHLEDSRLLKAERIGKLKEPLAFYLYRILQRNPQIPLIQGDAAALFEGKLCQAPYDSRDSWSRYVLPSDPPRFSTSFWIPNFSLRVGYHFDKLRVFSRDKQLSMRYVAVEPRLQAGDEIPAWSLLRVSLARPWSPDEHTPPRSYMMLSQYYGTL